MSERNTMDIVIGVRRISHHDENKYGHNPKKCCGQKKGFKLDVINITSGGVGGHIWPSKQKGEDSWNFCMPMDSDNGSEDDSSYSASSESEFDALEEGEYDEEEDIGVMEMVLNRIIPIERFVSDDLLNKLLSQLCCEKSS